MKNPGLKLVAIVFIGICCFVAGNIYTRQMGGAPEAEALAKAGQDALNTRDYTSAIEQFGRALTLSPDDPGLHGSLGLAFAGAGRNPEAISEFEESLRLDPEQLDIKKQLGMELFKAERFREAKNNFEQFVSSKTDDAQVYQWLFTTNQRLELPLENLSVLERLTALRPDDEQYKYALVMMYQEKNQFGDALQAFDALPAAEQKTDKGQYVLASIYFKQNNYPKAIELLEQVVRNNPQHDDAKELLERSYPLAEKTKQAQQDIEQVNAAIEANPENAELHFQLGLALHKAKRTEEATTAFQESLSRLDPEQIAIAKKIGKGLFDIQRFDEAEQCFKLIAEKAEDAEIYELLLAIGSRSNRPLDNLPILKELTRLRPEDNRYTVYLLGIYLGDGQLDEALRVVESLSEEQREKVENQYVLGVIYYQKKDYTKAIEAFENVEAKEPDFKDTKKLLGLCRSERSGL